jgi:UrcA family protein
MKIIGIAILAAGILAGSSGAIAAERENVALKINTAGVDFSSAQSVAAFRRDLARQIEAACNPGNRLNADLAPDWKCRGEMAASVEPTIQQLVARATNQRLATLN